MFNVMHTTTKLLMWYRLMMLHGCPSGICCFNWGSGTSWCDLVWSKTMNSCSLDFFPKLLTNDVNRNQGINNTSHCHGCCPLKAFGRASLRIAAAEPSVLSVCPMECPSECRGEWEDGNFKVFVSPEHAHWNRLLVFAKRRWEQARAQVISCNLSVYDLVWLSIILSKAPESFAHHLRDQLSFIFRKVWKILWGNHIGLKLKWREGEEVSRRQ